LPRFLARYLAAKSRKNEMAAVSQRNLGLRTSNTKLAIVKLKRYFAEQVYTFMQRANVRKMMS
jgi:hypothetical protein